jgi:non-specific serine/threonine protein kinase
MNLLAWCLIRLGVVVYSGGDLGRAEKLTEEGVALLRELGAVGAQAAIGLCNLGWIVLLQDDPGRAADLYEESLALAGHTGMNGLILSVVEGCACVAGARSEGERAAQLWGAAQALHEGKSIPRDTDWLAEAEARIAALRSGLGEKAWEAAFAKGKAMGLDEAVEYALSEGEPAATTLSAPEQPSVGAQSPNLTRREREVAKLVAQGLTNRQIAEALFVSERTVDHHVSNILKKLSLSSREQVASRLAAH